MRKYIIDADELKVTEKVLRTTKSYVPIFTSDVITQYKKLNSKFKYALVNTNKTRATCQAVLDNNIVLQNSFDGTQSFRIKYNLGSFIFGNFRLVHRGINATDFNSNQEFFISTLDKYTKFQAFLKNSTFSDEIIKDILKEVSVVKNKDVIIEYKSLNGIDVLNSTVIALQEGDYTYINKGTIKHGRQTRSQFALMRIQNSISKLLIEKYPEELV